MEYQPHEKGELQVLRNIIVFDTIISYNTILLVKKEVTVLYAATQATWVVSRVSGYTIVNRHLDHLYILT